MRVKILLTTFNVLLFSVLLGQTLDTLPETDSIFTTIDLSQYVVTGQYGPTDNRSSIYDVKVIDRKTIELSGNTNLQQVLSTQLNTEFQLDQFLGGSVSMQGTSEENIKILRDGVPMIGRQGGNIDLSQISLSNVERIEIIEGPVSAIYGNNALGGVINIITKASQLHPFEMDINHFAESIGKLGYDTRVGVRLGKSYVQLTGGLFDFNGYSADTLRSVFFNPKSNHEVGALYRYIGKNEQSLKADFYYSREKLSDLGNIRRPQFKPYAFDDYYFTERLGAGIHYSSTVLKNYFVDFSSGYNYYERKNEAYQYFFETMEKDTLALAQDTTENSSLFGRATFSSQYNGKINFQTGVDLNYESITGERINDTTSTRASYAELGDYSVFASLRYSPVKRVTIVPAVRATYHTNYKAPITPSLNIKYDVTDEFSIRAGYARGFRAPSLKELYHRFDDINHTIYGNAELKAEHSNNYQLNLKFKKTLDEHSKMTLTAGGYYNQFYNRIDLQENFGGISELWYQYKNFGDTVTFGGNSQLRFDVNAITVSTGVSLNAIENDLLVDNIEAFPEFSYALNTTQAITYHWKKQKVKFNITRKDFAKRTWYFKENGTVKEGYKDGFGLMDFSINKTLWKDHVSITVGITNILNVTEVGSLGAQAIHAGNEISTTVGSGRAYFVKLNTRFYSE